MDAIATMSVLYYEMDNSIAMVKSHVLIALEVLTLDIRVVNEDNRYLSLDSIQGLVLTLRVCFSKLSLIEAIDTIFS